MTASTRKGKIGQGNLLDSDERGTILRLAAGQPPHNQRAQALLALDGEASQATAAEDAGLTLGQVNYWLRKFRKERLGIFPQDLLPAHPASLDAHKDEPAGEMQPQAAADTLDDKDNGLTHGRPVKEAGDSVQSAGSSMEEEKPPRKKKESKEAVGKKDKEGGSKKGKKDKSRKKAKKSKLTAKVKKKKKAKGDKKGKRKKAKKAKDEMRKKDKDRKSKKKKKKS